MEKTIKEIAEDLHDINFRENGVIHPDNGGRNYDYMAWKNNGDNENCFGKHCYDKKSPQESYCNCKECANVKGKGRFTPVSHGTHMYDFLMAHTLSDCNKNGKNFEEKFEAKMNEVDGWSKKPVLFVMENPAGGRYDIEDNPSGKNVYKLFDDKNKNEYKNPTTSWYWLSCDYNEWDEKYTTDRFIDMGEYGRAVYSIMKIFHIANGYLTNMVKCGMGKDNTADGYTTTDKYPKGVVENCIQNRLITEIETLSGNNINNLNSDEIIIFAFGNRTKNRLEEYFKSKNINILVTYLPHPARAMNKIERRKLIYKNVDEALKGKGFYNPENYNPQDWFKDCYEQPKVNAEKIDAVIDCLKSCLNDLNKGYELEPKNGYNKVGKIITYTYTTENYTKDNENTQYIETLTLRYKMKKEEALKYNEKDVGFIWAQYDFVWNDIDLYVGYVHDDGANNWVANSADLETFDLYKIMCEFKERIKDIK